MKNIIKCWMVAALFMGAAAPAARAQSPRLDPSFAITGATMRRPNSLPTIKDMALQPDGKLVVVGDFIGLNGRSAVNVARLLPDGQVDLTFAAPVFDDEIASVALQADGKLLVGGRFTTVGGQSRIGIARLLPNGGLDLSFLSPLGGGPLPLVAYSNVEKIVLQPGRGILLLGVMTPIIQVPFGGLFAARLLEATGALDSTFRPGFNVANTAIEDVLVQPSGHLVFAGQPQLIYGQLHTVWGALPDGALDPAFVPLLGVNSYFRARRLARDPATGNLYVTRDVGGTSPAPLRLLPNGVPDPAFRFSTAFAPGVSVGPGSVAVQPNGRVLLGGDFAPLGGGLFGTVRLLPSGALDPSYDPRQGPGRGWVSKVLVQPDGKLLFAGEFQRAGGFSLNCLARMLDPNVLVAARNGATEADELAAWPVPARDVLHLRLPAGRTARQVALLDALGRVVLRQAVPAGQATPVLPVAGLAPGAYLLRVDFAAGAPAYRRVAVE